MTLDRVLLNTMMAESLDYAATFLENAMHDERLSLGEAVQKLIENVMEEDSAVIFNGNGYSEIWQREAERRGLPNYPATPDAVPVFSSPEVVELCERYQVFSRQELKAREDILLEQYIKSIHTECSLAVRMARTQIYPAAVRYPSGTLLVGGLLRRARRARVAGFAQGALRSHRWL